MKRKLTAILCAGILGASLITGGCGNSASTSADSNSAVQSESSEMLTEELGDADAAAPDEKIQDSAARDDSGEASTDTDASLGGTAASTVKSQNQKLIFTYNYSVETKEFDTFYEKISKKTEQIGGYVESSETYGSAADGVNRSASLVLRIPADQMNQMLSLLDSDSNVTYQSRSSENVTLRYVDMESHLKALRIEQETLLQLLETAEKLKDVIKLHSQLTQIRYEIESYESQLRMYDNQIEYSTLYLDISEVQRETTVASSKTTFFEEVSNLFSDNLYGVGQWLRSAVIWLIGSLPVLLPLVVIVIAIVLFLVKKHKSIRNKIQAAQTEDPGTSTEDNSTVKEEDTI